MDILLILLQILRLGSMCQENHCNVLKTFLNLHVHKDRQMYHGSLLSFSIVLNIVFWAQHAQSSDVTMDSLRFSSIIYVETGMFQEGKEHHSHLSHAVLLIVQ